MTLEEKITKFMYWIKSCTEDSQLINVEKSITNCVVKIHSLHYPINEIVRAENVIIGAIKLRQIELDSIGEDVAKTRMYEQNYVNSVHSMD